MKLSEKYPDIFAELSQEIKSNSEESYTTDESSADESSSDELSVYDELSVDDSSSDESSSDESSADESSSDESSSDESSSDESSSDESRYEYKVICSPIPFKKKTDLERRKGKPCARTDFEEQKERNRHILDADLFWCWDDGPQNKANEGDIFIFWNYDGKGKGGPGNPWAGGTFIFHKVISVRNPNERLPSWSANVGQSHRNVLELSPPKFELTYDEMIKYGAKPQYHGTKYPKAGFERGSPLIKMIDEQFK